jgi:hypothetical protein
VKESFKIGKFICKRKLLSSSQLNSLLAKAEEQLQALSEQDREEKSGLVEKLTNKIKSLKQGDYQE